MTNDTAVSPILGTLLALAMLALACTPVMAANVTYPQEYYTLGTLGDVLLKQMPTDMRGNAMQSVSIPTTVIAWELRRQTTPMEKQNELLAEQNELMGRLANATEIKFVVYPNPVYATQATSWNLDDPEASQPNTVPCANLTQSERANYGCPT